jgi:hypothetical protein
MTQELSIRPMTLEAIGKVRALEHAVRALPQVEVPIEHVLHAGMYARTARIPAGVIVTGAYIRLATVLIVSGDVTVDTGDGPARLTGYHVVEAAAGRKQAFITHTDTALTMLFPTQARTVEEAESEFTNEADRLTTRIGGA